MAAEREGGPGVSGGLGSATPRVDSSVIKDHVARVKEEEAARDQRLLDAASRVNPFAELINRVRSLFGTR